LLEVKVLHAQAQTFQQAQAAAVKHLTDEPIRAGQLGQHEADFGPGENDRQAFRPFGANHAFDASRIDSTDTIVDGQIAHEGRGGRGRISGERRTLALLNYRAAVFMRPRPHLW
jgi:hypothetical protein